MVENAAFVPQYEDNGVTYYGPAALGKQQLNQMELVAQHEFQNLQSNFSIAPMQQQQQHNMPYSYANSVPQANSLIMGPQRYQSPFATSLHAVNGDLRNPLLVPCTTNFCIQPLFAPQHSISYGFKPASPLPINRANHFVAVAEPFVAFDQRRIYRAPSHSCISYANSGFSATDPNFSIQNSPGQTNQSIRLTPDRCHANSASFILPSVLQDVEGQTNFSNRHRPTSSMYLSSTAGSCGLSENAYDSTSLYSSPNLASFGDAESRRLQSCSVGEEYASKWGTQQCYSNELSHATDSIRFGSRNSQQFSQIVLDDRSNKRVSSFSEFCRSSGQNTRNKNNLLSVPVTPDPRNPPPTSREQSFPITKLKLVDEKKTRPCFIIGQSDDMNENVLLTTSSEGGTRAFSVGSTGDASRNSLSVENAVTDHVLNDGKDENGVIALGIYTSAKESSNEAPKSFSHCCDVNQTQATTESELVNNIRPKSSPDKNVMEKTADEYNGQCDNQQRIDSFSPSKQVLPCCTFCMLHKEDTKFCESHSIFDRSGNIMCPKLRQTKCSSCSILGHTAFFCPRRRESAQVFTDGSPIRKICSS